MKVLILGGSGMLGHKLWQICSDRFNTFVTVRQRAKVSRNHELFDSSCVIRNVEVGDFDSVAKALEAVRPSVVVNCIGIVKQEAAAKDPVTSISVNSLFPHRLAQLCRAANIRLIHLSTDCIFSGRKGNYTENDRSDAEDLYGRTKYLGEVSDPGCLTLRTSIIGRELSGSNGLLEWFLSQQGKSVRGFRRAVFGGFTTLDLAEIIARIIAEHPGLDGVWHVASEPINKFDLLSLVRHVYGLEVEIEPDETFFCDRSLNGTRFREATGFCPRPWSEMIQRMHADATPYDEIRRADA